MAAKILSGLTRATKIGQFTGTGTADDTITIGGQAYTIKNSVSTTAYEVKKGASAAATCTNLVAAINKGTGSGTLYGSLTAAHPAVTAVDNGDATLTLYARTSGVIGNYVTLAESGTGFNWSGGATALSGGQGQFEELIETQLENLQDYNQLNASALRIVNDMISDCAL